MLTQSFSSSSSSSSSLTRTPTLRDTLRSAVDDSKLSKQDIAARAGISRRALYSLLEGEADPRLSTLEALSHVLGLTLFATPKSVSTLRLSSPSTGKLSEHSRVRRLLAQGQGWRYEPQG